MIQSLLLVLICSVFANDQTYWIKLNAKDKFERSVVANAGASIEVIREDYVIASGSKEDVEKLKEIGMVLETFKVNPKFFDFPERDRNFHNYNEMIQLMTDLQKRFPDFIKLEKIGKSIEGREILNLRISTDLENSHNKPAIAIMATHHAREHLSTEMPLLLAKYLAENYQQNSSIRNLIETREIHIIPMVNPDGVEYDIAGGNYKSWRKNRRKNSNGTYGVDLNRNYGYQWGTGGSSANPSSDTYKGTAPFSEPETFAIKTFIEERQNINIVLSLHTFSELILYPWGHSYSSIANQRDALVHKTMAETMAKWNRYKPQQASDLYIASGDTTDWTYGQHGIVSFTFELDPKSGFFSGGFYPGQGVINGVFQKNLPAFLYLIDHADNPYRSIETKSNSLGFNTDLF